MRLLFVAAIPALILFAGCATPNPVEYQDVPGPSQSRVVLPPPAEPAAALKPAPVKQQRPAKSPKPAIVTPDEALRGKVARYNETGRFVVLEFPIAHLPRVGQSLFVYRNDLKVGEVRVCGPQRDDRTVADLTAGEAQAGDDVREQ